MRATLAASRILSAIAVVSLTTLPARAAERGSFAIPAGPLGSVLRAIADQAGGEIGYSDSMVRGLRSPGVRGTLSFATALNRALAGTGLRARSLGPGRYLIEPATPSPAPAPVRKPEASAVPAGSDIVVTGSKRATTLARFPGAVRVLPLDGTGGADHPIADSADLVARSPLLQSTAFGPGRDKLFVRGIADSSFAGPTQATVGHYFGETRLLYSGAEPSLKLVDTHDVEILEGPQGTLYGAGAIGGIVRIVPNAPDPSRFGMMMEGRLAATEGGRVGGGLNGALNLPVVADHAAVRLVGYHAHDGGYLDNRQLGLRAINGVNVDGGRGALHVETGGDWTIDLTGLGQRSRMADPQYALRGPGTLGASAALRQPYSDWIALGSMTVRHDLGDGYHVLANIGGVKRGTRMRYDASRPGAIGPLAYDERTASSLVDGEIRVWRTSSSGSGWLAGFSALENRTAARRQLGPPDSQRDISGVDNRSLNFAVFGEGTLALSPSLSLTAGGRLTHARIDGQPLAARPQSPFIRGRGYTRFDPTAGFSMKLAPGLVWYGRYAQAFRAGGLAVAAGVGRVAVYESDDIRVIETGLRADRLLDGRLSATLGVSRAWWRDVQADLVSRAGFPFTANIGDGRINALEAQLAFRPVPRLRWDGEALLAHSRLIRPAPGFERDGGNALPDTPRLGLATGLTWFPPIDATHRFALSAALRRQGRSRFGAGPLFGIDQRGYTAADLSAVLERGIYRIRLGIDNVANGRGDRFAVGNPFQLRMRDQYTPLRPRTVSVTLTVRR